MCNIEVLNSKIGSCSSFGARGAKAGAIRYLSSLRYSVPYPIIVRTLKLDLPQPHHLIR